MAHALTCSRVQTETADGVTCGAGRRRAADQAARLAELAGAWDKELEVVLPAAGAVGGGPEAGGAAQVADHAGGGHEVGAAVAGAEGAAGGQAEPS